MAMTNRQFIKWFCKNKEIVRADVMSLNINIQLSHGAQSEIDKQDIQTICEALNIPHEHVTGIVIDAPMDDEPLNIELTLDGMPAQAVDDVHIQIGDTVFEVKHEDNN